MRLPAKVLIVDDVEANRTLLADMMFALGHDPATAENGQVALELMGQREFDLVLLDILMPVMDGCETLTRIKKDEHLRHTPVVVISAVDELENVVRCITAGAEDYLVKPFNATLLKARISACLDRKRLHDQEEKHRAELEEANRVIQQQNEELKESNELKDRFLQIASHDIRNPLTIIAASVYTLRRDLGENLLPNHEEVFSAIDRATRGMSSIVETFLEYQKIREDKCTVESGEVDLNRIAAEVVFDCQEVATRKRIVLELEPDIRLPHCRGDSNRLGQVLTNYVSNALKFAPADTRVVVRTKWGEMGCRCEVQDQGPGVKPEERERLFQEFARISNAPTGKEKSTGLGLSIVKHLVEMQCGRVGAEFPADRGSIFWFEVPAAGPKP